MKTGFYNLRKLSKEELKKFFLHALELSYKSNVQHIVGCCREVHPHLKPLDLITDEYMSKRIYSVCIDRSVQHSKELYGEIGFSTMCEQDLLLYIFVSLDNLRILVETFGLKEK